MGLIVLGKLVWGKETAGKENQWRSIRGVEEEEWLESRVGVDGRNILKL